MTRNRQQTASRIKAAAMTLLQRDGFEGWGINAVAREAQVDKVLLYRYFESLDGLLSEIISETRFWPDPGTLAHASAESFIRETVAFQEKTPIARQLIAMPESHSCFAQVRDRFWDDLDVWLAGFRGHCDGFITESQLLRLPAIIHFQCSTGSQKLSGTELWQQVSPPLEWKSDHEFLGFEELPDELL